MGAVLATGVAMPTTAHAQTLEAPRARQGYYLALGLLGFANVQWRDKAYDGWRGGNAFSLRLGQMLTRRFGLGLRVESGGAKSGDKTYGTAGLGLEAQFNPWRELSLHAGSGLGFASLNDPSSLEETTKGGFGAVHMLGASYDIFFTNRLTGGWSVAPTMMVRYLPSESLGGVWFLVGVQGSWWSGRSRNELVLPESEAYKR